MIRPIKLQMKQKPQMSPKEIEYICNLSKKYEHLVEFGSGASTLIWEKKFRQVTSVETRLNWYLKIQKKIEKSETRYLFCPPESRAYSRDAKELWNTRIPSDYGTVDEFDGYFKMAKELVESAQDHTIFFVDGNLREEISKLILHQEKNFLILLHDVLPERAYLNDWVLDADQIEETELIDSLLVIRKKP